MRRRRQPELLCLQGFGVLKAPPTPLGFSSSLCPSRAEAELGDLFQGSSVRIVVAGPL